jgi:hypothetical protein
VSERLLKPLSKEKLIMTTDHKPVAVGGPVMRRTDSHITDRNKPEISRSGDQHQKFAMFNTTQTKYSDDDPRWGLSPDDPDYPI